MMIIIIISGAAYNLTAAAAFKAARVTLCSPAALSVARVRAFPTVARRPRRAYITPVPPILCARGPLRLVLSSRNPPPPQPRVFSVVRLQQQRRRTVDGRTRSARAQHSRVPRVRRVNSRAFHDTASGRQQYYSRDAPDTRAVGRRRGVRRRPGRSSHRRVHHQVGQYTPHSAIRR